MSKKRKPGDIARIRNNSVNAFVLVLEQDGFEADADKAVWCAINDSGHNWRARHGVVDLAPGTQIELVHTAVGVSRCGVVRVFRLPDGRLACSYGGATRDYAWLEPVQK